MKSLLPLPLLLALAASPALAKEQDRCEIDIDTIDRLEPADDYDPYGGASLGYGIIEIEHEDGPACTVLIGIDNGRNGTRVLEDGGHTLVYDLYRDGSRTDRINDIGGPTTGLFRATLGPKDEASFQVYTYLPPGQLVPKGTYDDRVTVSVYELRNGTPVGPIAQRQGRVKAKVREVVSASVTVNGVTRALSGSSGVLDMGELSRSGGGSFDLNVSGNSDYHLSLSSENDGRLISAQNRTGIGYTVSVAGRTLSLSRGTSLDLGGDGRYRIDIQVDDVSRALAGSYSDNLILTISAR